MVVSFFSIFGAKRFTTKVRVAVWWAVFYAECLIEPRLLIGDCRNTLHLADALRSTLPELKSRISTFHELAIAALRRQQPDVPLDFSKPDTFSTAVDALAEDMTWMVGIDAILVT